MNSKLQSRTQPPGEGARNPVDSLPLPFLEHAEELRDFANRLRSVSERARKLLVQIAELAYHGRGKQRKPDVAYLPELYESCGLGVEAMYPLLDELRAARLVEVEDQYPFEDVKISPASSGWNVLAATSRFCESEKVSLRDVIVDLRFDLLQ
jgi:hypothetical protein